MQAVWRTTSLPFLAGLAGFVLVSSKEKTCVAILVKTELFGFFRIYAILFVVERSKHFTCIVHLLHLKFLFFIQYA